MKTLLLILILCWPFHFRQRQHTSRLLPTAPRQDDYSGHWVWIGGSEGHWKWEKTTYKWVETPHWENGYWVEYTPDQMADKTGKEAWRGYVFSRYVWEWPGYEQEKTWIDEGPHNKPPEKPKHWISQESYNPNWPGQRNNL